jgi:hypothetical protein
MEFEEAVKDTDLDVRASTSGALHLLCHRIGR